MIPKFPKLRAAAAAAALSLPFVLASCESGTGPEPEPARPGLTIVGAREVSDTVSAFVPDLVVEVRGPSGSLLRDTEVRFYSTQPDRPPTVALVTPSGEHRSDARDTTDAQGRASMRIRMGTSVETGKVYVAIPELGYADSASYTVRAGAVAEVKISPADTAAYVGGGYRITGQATDRFGNARPEPVSFATGTAAVATVAGDQVSAAAIGRGFVLATAGAVTDTAWISVVPRGTIAVRNRRLFDDYRDRATFAVLDLDGSGLRYVLRGEGTPQNFGGNNTEMGPEWTPSGDEIAFYDGYPDIHLWATTLDGTVRQLLPPTVGNGIHATPRFSSDGQWMYFNLGLPGSYRTQVWRARPDGSAPERVTSGESGFYINDLNADPSPDGTRIVYMTDRERTGTYDSRHHLRVQDVATGAVRSLGVEGTLPRWAPNSEWIVFWRDYRLYLIRADGTGERAITPANMNYDKGASWSPDGEWIVAARFGEDSSVDLIRVETGLLLPLAFTHRYVDPVWKP